MTDDLITVTTKGRAIKTWQTATITRSIEGYPSSFVLSMAEAFPDDPTQMLVGTWDDVTIDLGKDRVLTGWVDTMSPSIESGRHDVLVTGRGLGQDLVDCTADFTDTGLIGGQITNTNAVDLAQKLIKPFQKGKKDGQRIEVVKRFKEAPTKIDYIEATLGETPYEIIERASRFTSIITYEGERGEFIMDTLGTKKMASGFAQGVNVERAQVTFSSADRFSRYDILWQSIDRLSQIGTGANYRQTVTDPTVKRYRPRTIISDQWMPGVDFAKRRAEWELARRIGRSQAVTLTCDSWRDTAGELWQVNALARVNLPAWKIVDVEWLIGAVTFRKDPSGTHADLILMPQDAFRPQPRPLNVFDWQIGQSLHGGSTKPGSIPPVGTPGGPPT